MLFCTQLKFHFSVGIHLCDRCTPVNSFIMTDYELLAYKTGYVILIVIITLICSILPLSLTKVSPALQTRILSLCNSFAGGVFLASGFVHLLNEAIEMADDLGWGDYPVGSILSVMGFLTVFGIEQVLLAEFGHSHSHSSPEESEHDHGHSHDSVEIISSDTSEVVVEMELRGEPEKEITKIEEEPVEMEPTNPQKSGLSFVSIAIVIILSTHSFFTGVTIGVQETVTSTTEILFTVLSHKWVEAFALGSNLLRNGESVMTIIKLSLVYSFTLPFGVIAGTIIINILSEDYANIVTMAATAFGSGSFVYVAIVDILMAEFKDEKDRILKFLLVTGGFLCISALFIFFDND